MPVTCGALGFGHPRRGGTPEPSRGMSLPSFYLPPTQGDRFQAHSKLGNRRLLWHGTNVAVVAAILTSGLRIMPHSGGRVGKGIYFASENSKSAGYGEATLGGDQGGDGGSKTDSES